MKRSMTAFFLALALGVTAGPAFAQQTSTQSGSKPMLAATGAHSQAAMNDYKAAMEKMQQAMMAAQDPDADRAWALKMIEHHRGAIAMSEIVIKHGDDSEAKRMAQKTIDAQKKDIAELETWLDKHGGKMSKP